MSVPPLPSLAAANSLAVYWPSSWMLTVWTPSVTVSVPLRLPAASVKLRWAELFLVVPKAMPCRSISSGLTPAPYPGSNTPKPATTALRLAPASRINVLPALSWPKVNWPLVRPPLATSSVPSFRVRFVATPPDCTTSRPPSRTSSLIVVPPLATISTALPRTHPALSVPPLLTMISPALAYPTLPMPVPSASPPLDTTRVAPAASRVPLASPPLATTSTPPLSTVVSYPQPCMISVAPPRIVLKESRPPDTTATVPPLLTVALNVWPPEETTTSPPPSTTVRHAAPPMTI